jgi:hypothetical protein
MVITKLTIYLASASAIFYLKITCSLGPFNTIITRRTLPAKEKFQAWVF